MQASSFSPRCLFRLHPAARWQRCQRLPVIGRKSLPHHVPYLGACTRSNEHRPAQNATGAAPESTAIPATGRKSNTCRERFLSSGRFCVNSAYFVSFSDSLVQVIVEVRTPLEDMRSITQTTEPGTRPGSPHRSIPLTNQKPQFFTLPGFARAHSTNHAAVSTSIRADVCVDRHIASPELVTPTSTGPLVVW